MTTFDDIALNRRSTADQVAAGLTDKIMRGELRPGDPIRESVVATALGVSRNTVREAMRLLEQGSLIRYEFNRGAVVKQPSSDEVRELYCARRILEVSAAGISTPDASAVASLERAFDRLSLAARAGDPREIVATDLQFHSALVSLLGNSRISAYFAELVKELEFYLMTLSFGEREYQQPEPIVAEHRRIVEAIQAGDAAGAARLVGDHIDRNAELVDLVLRARES